MSTLLGDVIISRNPLSLPAKDVLSGKVVAFYFSAHWCPPCRRFTKILKKFYEEVRCITSDMEIVFVSSDRSENDMREYLSIQPDWLYIPFGHPSISQLSRRFNVNGIPCVVIVSPSGEIITTGGRQAIENRESTEILLNEWIESSSSIVTPL